MPLKIPEILSILTQKQSEFTSFNQNLSDEFRIYRRALSELSRTSHITLKQKLSPISHPGAQPLEPFGSDPYWVMPCNLKWQSREASLEWVRDRLTNITTFSVDGSQIFPTKDISIPVALVQIGWFENPHTEHGTYTKDVRVDVISPMDLLKNSNCPVERQVNMSRFTMEVKRHIEFMQTNAHRDDCITFFDGSLVGSFAEVLDPESREFYANELVELLRASETYRVPLVGYIDTSNARDLVAMVRHLAQLPEAKTVSDVSLIGRKMNWGDRTPLFLCDRRGAGKTAGILSQYQEQAKNVTFTYLKTNDGNPARLELPRWIYEDGLLDTVLDYVRSEVIVGSGYPYVIETADQVAVLRADDRQMFYRLLQDWAKEQDLNLHFSRKMISKMFRRR